jgi:hypothetical protein
MEETRNTHGISVDKSVEIRQTEIPRRIWKDNIKMNLRHTGCGDGR